MLNPVELRLFPSCQDCLAWSADGELAVAGGEYVHILVCIDQFLFSLRPFMLLRTKLADQKKKKKKKDP